jgi:hypothetical protein
MAEHQSQRAPRPPARTRNEKHKELDRFASEARLTGFRIHQKRRIAEQIKAMIAESRHLVDALDREIRSEEERTRVIDPDHFAYSTIAKAAMLRRANLLQSMEILNLQLQQVENALADAIAAEGLAAGQRQTADGRLVASESDAA